MKRDQNNNSNIFYNTVQLSLCSLLFTLRAKLSGTGSKFLTLSSTLLALCFIFGWILYPGKANSGPYLDSAHGNTSYGVNRTDISAFGYSKGNCSHCHEQHASIGGSEPIPNTGEDLGPDIYLLFGRLWFPMIQKNIFCFGCHIEIGSYQSGGQVQNYSYSYRRGGDIALTCPDSIYESFQFVANDGTSRTNCLTDKGSSHVLQDIKEFLKNKWGFSSTGQNVDPCSGCHNPHKAKRDFPCSRPSAHTDIYAWDVWGDDNSEKMNVYSPNYWAPKRVGGGYEPDGSLTQDGSNLADYVTLCTDCHNSNTTINSTRLGRNLYKINWGPGGDFHGGRQRIDNGGDASQIGEYGDLLAPYKVGGSYQKINYVLSCTDCHEPHGSPNEFLLRKSLNGTNSVGIISANGLWYNWCQACHTINPPFTPTQHLPPVDPNVNCFSAEACHRHCDYPACADTRLF